MLTITRKRVIIELSEGLINHFYITSRHPAAYPGEEEKEKMESKKITKVITMTEENFQYCKSIAEDIENIVEGMMYKCPECGEGQYIEDIDDLEIEDEDGCTVYKMPCGCIVDEAEQLTLYDYFENALDIEYTVRAHDKQITGCRIMVACGGPNVYVNTNSGKVELYWWNEYAECYMSRQAIDYINDFAQELFEC